MISTLGTPISWETFQNDLLVPLVSELGAKTYQVLTGDQIEIEEASSYLAFLAKVPLQERKAVANRIVRFVDPNSQPIRSYVLRLLNTAFLVRAVTLPEGAMAKARFTNSPTFETADFHRYQLPLFTNRSTRESR